MKKRHELTERCSKGYVKIDDWEIEQVEKTQIDDEYLVRGIITAHAKQIAILEKALEGIGVKLDIEKELKAISYLIKTEFKEISEDMLESIKNFKRGN